MPKDRNKAKQGVGVNSLEHRIDQLNTLHEIDLAILEARSLDAISKAIFGKISQLLPKCEWACVTLFDTDAHEATILAAHSEKSSPYKSFQRLPLENFRVASHASQSTGAFIVGDLRDLEQPTLVEKNLIRFNMRSYMSIPLIARTKIIGTFNLSSSQKDVYTRECADIANEIGNSLAIAIENVRLIEAERVRNQELMAMTLVSAALRMAKTRAHISPIILDQLQSLFQTDSALLSKYNKSDQVIEIELGLGYWSKATGERFSETLGVFERTIVTKRPYASNDIQNDSSVTLPNIFGKISAVVIVPLISQGEVIGMLGVGRQTAFSKDQVRLLVAIADMVANTMQSVTLTDDLRQSNKALARAYDSTLEGWARALELRDQETKGHTQRVTALTMKLSRSMGIPDDELVHIRRGALLHDIGKMGVPDSILLKPDSLNEDEWAVVRRHPRFAFDMLSPIKFLRSSLDIPYYHHEKWDGTGYPNQLAGEKIPLAARIFAVADVFDALTSPGRPYRDAWTVEKTLNYIRAQSGGHFDPQVVDAFLQMMA